MVKGMNIVYLVSQPHSAGSGIPIVIAYLNGVSIPKVGSLKLLIVKVFGVILVSVSGLALGKVSKPDSLLLPAVKK